MIHQGSHPLVLLDQLRRTGDLERWLEHFLRYRETAPLILTYDEDTDFNRLISLLTADNQKSRYSTMKRHVQRCLVALLIRAQIQEDLYYLQSLVTLLAHLKTTQASPGLWKLYKDALRLESTPQSLMNSIVLALLGTCTTLGSKRRGQIVAEQHLASSDLSIYCFRYLWQQVSRDLGYQYLSIFAQSSDIGLTAIEAKLFLEGHLETLDQVERMLLQLEHSKAHNQVFYALYHAGVELVLLDGPDFEGQLSGDASLELRHHINGGAHFIEVAQISAFPHLLASLNSVLEASLLGYETGDPKVDILIKKSAFVPQLLADPDPMTFDNEKLGDLLGEYYASA